MLRETPLDLTALAEHKLFKDIPFHLVQPILADCPVRQLQPDEILLAPGEENHHLYLLVSGRLQVYLDSPDSQFSFPIEPGECIGEMSIIEARRTSAFVVAEKASSLIAVHEDLFWDKIVTLSGSVKNMLQMLSRRMRKHNEVTRQTLEQQLRYEHLQKELEAAGKIQANILPQEIPLLPKHPQVDVCAMIEPVKEVGGDFFDAIALDKEHVCVVIGDVSGKGLPSALFMVRVMTLLRASLSNADHFETVLPRINQMLCQNNADYMFATLFIAMLEVATGRLTYMNGGHNPPFVSLKGAPFELLQVPKGALVGIFEAVDYHVAQLTLKPGDTLVLYTDGITEAENRNREFFSTGRAGAVLRNIPHDEEVTRIVKTLNDAVIRFSHGMPQADDITVLALRYRGDSPATGPKL